MEFLTEELLETIVKESDKVISDSSQSLELKEAAFSLSLGARRLQVAMLREELILQYPENEKQIRDVGANE